MYSTNWMGQKRIVDKNIDFDKLNINICEKITKTASRIFKNDVLQKSKIDGAQRHH